MFRSFVLAIALAVLAITQAHAQSTKPTQASLNKLFELTNADAMIKNAQASTDTILKNMMQGTMNGKAVTPEQQKALDVFRAKIVKIQTDELNWDVLEPKLSDVYANTLTQEEVDGLIAFYQSPVGKSYASKMPLIMQQSMTAMQGILGPMMKKFEAAGVELKLDLQRIDQK